MPKPVSFDSYSFPSLTALKGAIRAVLHRYPLRTPVSDDADARFIAALFERHPDYAKKVAGRIIARFEVHPFIHGSRCFFAVFVEGGMIDFSCKPIVAALVRT